VSRENIDIFRAQVEAINRGDFDAWAELLHPEFEFEEPPDWPDRVSGRGREAARKNLLKAYELVEDVHATIEEVTELPDGRLLIETRTTGRGKGSGIPIELRRWDLMTFRDGMSARAEVYLRESDARKAAGLEG
jgi:ketosteroid isomerase-like protein